MGTHKPRCSRPQHCRSCAASCAGANTAPLIHARARHGPSVCMGAGCPTLHPPTLPCPLHATVALASKNDRDVVLQAVLRGCRQSGGGLPGISGHTGGHGRPAAPGKASGFPNGARGRRLGCGMPRSGHGSLGAVQRPAGSWPRGGRLLCSPTGARVKGHRDHASLLPAIHTLPPTSHSPGATSMHHRLARWQHGSCDMNCRPLSLLRWRYHLHSGRNVRLGASTAEIILAGQARAGSRGSARAGRCAAACRWAGCWRCRGPRRGWCGWWRRPGTPPCCRRRPGC